MNFFDFFIGFVFGIIFPYFLKQMRYEIRKKRKSNNGGKKWP